ncbi:hypothetical protein [Clostridium perfringens]|nr:hypothetical protein [Clostridium perfringens]
MEEIIDNNDKEKNLLEGLIREKVRRAFKKCSYCGGDSLRIEKNIYYYR